MQRLVPGHRLHIILASSPKMKKCEYCGREADDETSYCHECGTQFPAKAASESTEKPSTSAEGAVCATEAIGIAGIWTARDAWKCVGMLLVFWVVPSFTIGALTTRFPLLRHWTRQGAGHFIVYSLQFSISVLTALYFAQLKSVEAFLKRFGLDRPQVRTSGLG
jgi:hypothetical protein